MHEHRASGPKYLSECSGCRDAAAAKMRRLRATSPGFRKRQYKAARDRDKAIREWVASLKVERGCADCGYNKHPAALDFDHLPHYEKEFTVSHMRGFSRRAILAEIAKCEVVCSNCHRIRTVWRNTL